MEDEQFEASIEEYDEVEDAYEIRASREKYEMESANLLEKIKEREEMVKLLRLAKPEKIAEIRGYIAELDDYIKLMEEIVAMQYGVYLKRQNLRRLNMKLMAKCDAVEPELLKHVAEHNPEKLELLKAMLSDDDKKH